MLGALVVEPVVEHVVENKRLRAVKMRCLEIQVVNESCGRQPALSGRAVCGPRRVLARRDAHAAETRECRVPATALTQIVEVNEERHVPPRLLCQGRAEVGPRPAVVRGLGSRVGCWDRAGVVLGCAGLREVAQVE